MGSAHYYDLARRTLDKPSYEAWMRIARRLWLEERKDFL